MPVIHQGNQGPWAARNAGQEAARGAYLLFVDADDYFRYDMVQVL